MEVPANDSTEVMSSTSSSSRRPSYTASSARRGSKTPTVVVLEPDREYTDEERRAVFTPPFYWFLVFNGIEPMPVGPRWLVSSMVFLVQLWFVVRSFFVEDAVAYAILRSTSLCVYIFLIHVSIRLKSAHHGLTDLYALTRLALHHKQRREREEKEMRKFMNFLCTFTIPVVILLSMRLPVTALYHGGLGSWFPESDQEQDSPVLDAMGKDLYFTMAVWGNIYAFSVPLCAWMWTTMVWTTFGHQLHLLSNIINQDTPALLQVDYLDLDHDPHMPVVQEIADRWNQRRDMLSLLREREFLLRKATIVGMMAYGISTILWTFIPIFVPIIQGQESVEFFQFSTTPQLVIVLVALTQQAQLMYKVYRRGTRFLRKFTYLTDRPAFKQFWQATLFVSRMERGSNRTESAIQLHTVTADDIREQQEHGGVGVSSVKLLDVATKDKEKEENATSSPTATQDIASSNVTGTDGGSTQGPVRVDSPSGSDEDEEEVHGIDDDEDDDGHTSTQVVVTPPVQFRNNMKTNRARGVTLPVGSSIALDDHRRSSDAGGAVKRKKKKKKKKEKEQTKRTLSPTVSMDSGVSLTPTPTHNANELKLQGYSSPGLLRAATTPNEPNSKALGGAHSMYSIGGVGPDGGPKRITDRGAHVGVILEHAEDDRVLEKGARQAIGVSFRWSLSLALLCALTTAGLAMPFLLMRFPPCNTPKAGFFGFEDGASTCSEPVNVAGVVIHSVYQLFFVVSFGWYPAYRYAQSKFPFKSFPYIMGVVQTSLCAGRILFILRGDRVENESAATYFAYFGILFAIYFTGYQYRDTWGGVYALSMTAVSVEVFIVTLVISPLYINASANTQVVVILLVQSIGALLTRLLALSLMAHLHNAGAKNTYILWVATTSMFQTFQRMFVFGLTDLSAQVLATFAFAALEVVGRGTHPVRWFIKVMVVNGYTREQALASVERMRKERWRAGLYFLFLIVEIFSIFYAFIMEVAIRYVHNRSINFSTLFGLLVLMLVGEYASNLYSVYIEHAYMERPTLLRWVQKHKALLPEVLVFVSAMACMVGLGTHVLVTLAQQS